MPLLLEHYDLVLDILDKDADVEHLDFSKAFDKVDYAIVLDKMKKLGNTGGKMFHWLKSFLTERKQSVIVNGVKSKPQSVISGVPKGSLKND